MSLRLSERKIVIKRAEIDKIFEQHEFLVKKVEKTKKQPPLRYCYTIAEAQDKFNFSEKALYELIKRNNIAKYQNGWYTSPRFANAVDLALEKDLWYYSLFSR